MEDAVNNTDREIWREIEGDYYAPSIHVTEQGGVGINVGGMVYVKTLREWHALARRAERCSTILLCEGLIPERKL